MVKDLEEKNIGRPSTYAPIVGTLAERKYVTREKKMLVPTELGMLVTELMEKYFKEIVDVGFTAEMKTGWTMWRSRMPTGIRSSRIFTHI